MLDHQDLAWNEALDTLRDPWDRIVTEGALNPSLLPGWIAAIAASTDMLERLRVFALLKGEEVVGIVPYYRSRMRMTGVPIEVLNLASNLVSYHQEFVTLSDPNRLLHEFLSRFDEHGWNLLIVNNLPADGPAISALRDEARARRGVLVNYRSDSSPAMRLTGTWTDYLATKRKKFRYKIKRRRRDLLRGGEVEARWFDEASDVPALLEAILSIESHSWKVEADMAISEHPQEQRYYELLLPWMANRNLLLANVIYLDAEPIAYNLCYLWNGCLGQIKTSFDGRFAELSPGAAATEDAIRRGFEIGAGEFDFLGDVMPHKLEWATHTREHCNGYLFANAWWAKLIGTAKGAVQTWRKHRTSHEAER